MGLALLAITGLTGYGDALTPALLLAPPDAVRFPHTVEDVVRGALEALPAAVLELGVLLLIATPVLRVAASVRLFLHERDHLYAWVALAVLALLLVSIFWLS